VSRPWNGSRNTSLQRRRVFQESEGGALGAVLKYAAYATLLSLLTSMAPASPSPPASLDDVLDQLVRVLALKDFHPGLIRDSLGIDFRLAEEYPNGRKDYEAALAGGICGRALLIYHPKAKRFFCEMRKGLDLLYYEEVRKRSGVLGEAEIWDVSPGAGGHLITIFRHKLPKGWVYFTTDGSANYRIREVWVRHRDDI